MDVTDYETFTNHVITDHGFDNVIETWMNGPTNRAYHDHLHNTQGQDHTHPHLSEPPWSVKIEDLPEDVQTRLRKIYTEEGQALWLRVYNRRTLQERRDMLGIARTPDMDI